MSNRQLAFILFGIMFGYGSIGLPKALAENAATGGWVSILIATLLALISTTILVYLGMTHQNKTFYDYSKELSEKYTATILTLLYIVFMFIMFTLINKLSSDVFKQTILRNTPNWALITVFLITAYYAVIKGIDTIARLCEVYGLIIILFGVVIHFIAFTQGDLIRMQPFFVAEDLANYFDGAIKAKLAFSGMAIFSAIPFIKKQNHTIYIYSAMMLLLIAMLYIIQFESSIAVMGIDSIVFYRDALFTAIRRVDVPSLQFLRRLDAIFIISFIISIFLNITLFVYGTVFHLSKLLPKVSFRLLAFAVLSLSFLVCQLPMSFDEGANLLETASLAGGLILNPVNLILLLLSKVKKSDKKVC
ncbi:MAG: GerAB/ArcD/ProY family transporter [Firmicutes bacterium]|nr:GerAB/ArcD/ProY family transporter [Bacillota bacterium]